jgi:arylsulfatase A-like enzyme
MLADDLGWNDVGFHGSVIQTPHIDELARTGIELGQFYVQPSCTQTRAALLTGRYPLRYGLQRGLVLPWGETALPLDEHTLAERLREVGYRSAIVGKWHLGHTKVEELPTRRGFDHHYGHYLGHIGYFNHQFLGGLDWHRNEEPVQEKGYTTTLLAAEAVRLIESQPPSEPLFLYVAFNAPHKPLHAPRARIQRYAGIPDRRRRIHAAMVSVLDDAVGTILGALDRAGIREQTLVLFASDNGADPVGGDNRPLRGVKQSLYEGSVRAVALANWPGVIPGGRIDEPVHVVDLFPTLLRLGGGTPDPTLDGVDLWPTLVRHEPPARQEILLNVNHATWGKQGDDAILDGAALRRGPWKLVVTRREIAGEPRETIELFDIEADPSETTNQAEAHPDVVRELRERIATYSAQASPPDEPLLQPPADFEAPAVWGPTGHQASPASPRAPR